MNTLDIKDLLESKDLAHTQLNELVMSKLPRGRVYDHRTMHWGHNFDRTNLTHFNTYVKKGSLIQQSTPYVGDVLLGKQFKHIILLIERFENVDDAYWVWFVSIKL